MGPACPRPMPPALSFSVAIFSGDLRVSGLAPCPAARGIMPGAAGCVHPTVAPRHPMEANDNAGMSLTVATIASGNYLAYVQVLRDSVARHEPDARFEVLIVDRPSAEIDAVVAQAGL